MLKVIPLLLLAGLSACSSIKPQTGQDMAAASDAQTQSLQKNLKQDSQQQVLKLAQKAQRSGFTQLAIDMHKSQLEKSDSSVQGISRTELFWLYRQNKQLTRAQALLTETERTLSLAQVLANQAQQQQIAQRFNGLMNWRCIRAVQLLDNDDGKASVTAAWQWLNQAPALNSKIISADNQYCYPLQARLLTQQGKSQQAQNLYQRLLLNDPEYWPHRYNLALSYLLAQQHAKARALLLPACQYNDCALPLRQLLALSFGLEGNSQQALKWLAPLSPVQQQQQLDIYRQWQQHLQGDSSGDNALEKQPEGDALL